MESLQGTRTHEGPSKMLCGYAGSGLQHFRHAFWESMCLSGSCLSPQGQGHNAGCIGIRLKLAPILAQI